MTKRIFRSILTVSIVVLLACLVLIVGVLHGYFEDRVQEELQYRSTYIAQGIALKGMDYLNGLSSESRITWIAADGTVLYDNRENAADMENHSDREEVRKALQTGEGHSARYSHTLSEKTIYYAVRLSDGTVLRVSDTQYSVWILVLQVLQPVAVVTLLAIVLALLLSSRVAKQIVKPINGIDLANPGDEDAYEELTPFIARIRSQNRQINWQMSQLRRRQEEFAAITENMGEGFLVIDRRTNVLSYNSAALHLLDAAEPPKGTEVSVYTLNRESGFRRAVEEALNERRSEQLMEKDGRCRQVIASPVFQEDNTLTGAVLVILDITEKEQRESLRREFTANVSHELRTPLTSILGTAEIMYTAESTATSSGIICPGNCSAPIGRNFTSTTAGKRCRERNFRCTASARRAATGWRDLPAGNTVLPGNVCLKGNKKTRRKPRFLFALLIRLTWRRA